MTHRTDEFNLYVSAIEALKNLFANIAESSGETESSYNFKTDLKNLDWLNEYLLRLVKDLVPANFKIDILIEIDDVAGSLIFPKEAANLSNLFCDFQKTKPEGKNKLPLPEDAVSDYKLLKNYLSDNKYQIKFDDVFKLIKPLSDKGVKIKLSLNIFLNKHDINNKLLGNIEEKDRPFLVPYLFSRNVASKLDGVTFDSYEKLFYQKSKRTLIIIFDLSGYLKNDFLTILGKCDDAKVYTLIRESIPANSIKKYKNIIELRKSHAVGDFSTNLIPEMFMLVETGNYEDDKKLLIDKLKCLQATLSAIYLAGRVDINSGGYCILYRGFKQSKFLVSPEKFSSLEPYSMNIYKLYTYAFDGYSADKLDLAEKFVSLIAEDVVSLGKKATSIEDATRSAYDNILLGKTKEYFDAREKVQDTIKAEIKDVSESTITLAKETAKEVYTIAGLILLGLIGMALAQNTKPWVTALVISIILSAYMFLTIRYYLDALKKSNDLRLEQHNAFILSFRDILGEKTTEDFMENKNIKSSNLLFQDQFDDVTKIYLLILGISLLAVYISLYALVNNL